MKLFSLCVALCVSAVMAQGHPDLIVRAEIVDEINSMDTTWTAKVHPRFADKSYEFTERLCGVKDNGFRLSRKAVKDFGALPDEFDSRTNWPNCPTIQEVRDQSDCGSCWAHSTSEAASDRVCIQTNGKVNLHLSAEDLTSCCSVCGNGCNGGQPASAWQWFTRTGIVTGGNYGDFSMCRSYSLPNCDHHTTGQYPPCGGTEYPTPKCVHACDANTTDPTSYDDDKTKFKTAYSISSNPNDIMSEIMTSGPVSAAFSVYADFEAYTSGIYQHKTGKYLGGHAVKIIGWGVDNNTPYWNIANSWNVDWGEKGFFRILRGTDECGIEDQITAGSFV